ncbi:hypothetical protein DES36_12637 [Alkalibaculum bacchi]|uniref:Uncharacterized protein n=1 Tax=Alkalibaculum bacchi TaxID=645887 RepID=A0A366HZN1_9FIRM|nr:hypothetical protein [Alkalibaculum bacchi]RBP57965.1 hypothetical protein DES36_12637 [Alkalibaculum bacchi]
MEVRKKDIILLFPAKLLLLKLDYVYKIVRMPYNNIVWLDADMPYLSYMRLLNLVVNRQYLFAGMMLRV